MKTIHIIIPKQFITQSPKYLHVFKNPSEKCCTFLMIFLGQHHHISKLSADERGKVQSNESSKPPNKCNPNKLHPPMEQSVTIVITQMENLKKHISGADES